VTSIEVRVATIVTDTEIAFNAGSDQGVSKGDLAEVQREIVISDPDTKEELGSVLVAILNLRIDLVDPKFCIGLVTDLQETENDLGNVLIGRNRRKKIVGSRNQERAGVSVYVAIGAKAEITLAAKDAEGKGKE
jgi:hypothetical protein